MSDAYTFLANLATALPEVPPDSIISHTVHKDERLHAILFGFAAGQELSEHTSAYPAILHFISGRATLTLGSDAQVVEAGAWAYMQPRLPHSVIAETPVTMLLLILRGAEKGGRIEGARGAERPSL